MPRTAASHHAPMRLSLFWRTFLLVAVVIALGVLATLELLSEFDRSPPDRQLTWEIASVVNLTRAALVNSEGDRRQTLLRELQSEEGLRVIPLETSDAVVPLTSSVPLNAALARSVETRLRTMLGNTTRLAGKVNGIDGLWVSFDIDGDPYWLHLERDRFERQVGPNWWLIFLTALGLSTLGSLAISQLINRPLARLARAIEVLSRGRRPAPLPERAPSEIAEVNRRFNRMATDLAELESDRALALAGISHDVRTPLSRLRLEIELSHLPESDKLSMAEDIERIDQIVAKFLEYGRSAQADKGHERIETLRIAELLDELRTSYRSRIQDATLEMRCQCDPELTWVGDPLDLVRALSNLIENALRYGRSADGVARVDIAATRERGQLLLQCSDQGSGVPAEQFDRLLRPFSRLDEHRPVSGGVGLGLAIVARVASRYDGTARLSHGPNGGLRIELALHDAIMEASDDDQGSDQAAAGSPEGATRTSKATA